MICTPVPMAGFLGNYFTTCVDSDAPIKRVYPTLGGAFSYSIELDEPVDVVALTFSKIKPGSEIHIYDPDGNEIAFTESATPSDQLVVMKYRAGSPKNTIRVFIASLGYENLDFDIALSKSTDVPTFQRIDRNYRNQA